MQDKTGCDVNYCQWCSGVAKPGPKWAWVLHEDYLEKMRSKSIAVMPCSFVVKTLTLPGLRHSEKSWHTAMALVQWRI